MLPSSRYPDAMKHPLPSTPEAWLQEIRLAIADARKAKPFGILVGRLITDAKLFHLAPLVALKFRGRRTRGAEADKVIETALANYVVNTEQHGLTSRPLLAFALCYVATHLALDMLDEQDAEAILEYCDEHL
jgi:hypothetical protein